MSWTVFKLAAKARGLPEVAVVVRLALGLAGGFLLFRAASNLRVPGDLTALDYGGLALFVAVGVWLLRVAFGKRSA